MERRLEILIEERRLLIFGDSSRDGESHDLQEVGLPRKEFARSR
jgi:hypothetical protein